MTSSRMWIIEMCINVYQWAQTQISSFKQIVKIHKPNKARQVIRIKLSAEMAKIRLQVTIRDNIVKWMDKEIEARKFATRSHAIEYSLMQLMEKDK